ncbi:putative Outer membrane porin protein 32 precursor; 3-hydroxyphenylpropionic acid porine [Rubrivivax sp. A210]|uniref:porin n=1 Tax=Rubrivivax sp. A210 TaxID=2772301 RepID=UPI00191853F3|nr:porin [Rubrivivax sp. A210]CAD5375076.1 putative Outer membrane porin protein 32 precursor; 3-hydroxyphenylpropionic acid porine [Rubrivivax sp. A210]
MKPTFQVRPSGARSKPARAIAVLIAATAATAAAPAAAQSVTVYGLIDLAVEHVTKVGAAGSGLTRMPSLTGTVSSRIGLRGSEDLGGGLRAVYAIEQGFAPDQGTLIQGGRAWGRQAFVGLAGNWGTVSLGRQYTMLFWSILDADVMGPALYGTGSLDAYIPNARADNALAWKGTFGGLTLGATYSLGRDTVNAGSPAGTNCAGESATDTKACREWSALAKVDTPAWGAALAIDEMRGGAGAFAGLTRSEMRDRRVSANGYGKFGGLKATLGLIRRDNGASAATPKSDLWYLGASWAASSALTLEGQWHTLRIKNGGGDADLLALRAAYAFSRRTSVYAMLGRIDNSAGLSISVSAGAGGSNPAPGVSQSAFAAGLRHAF